MHQTVSRLLAVFVALAVATSPVAAAEPDWSGDLFSQFETVVGLYNEGMADVDSNLITGQMKGAMNLYVSDGTETAHYSFFVTDAGRITQLRQGLRDDAARKMVTTRGTLTRLSTSSDPAGALSGALAGDDIRIEGEKGHAFESAKWKVINAVKGPVTSLLKSLGLF